MGAADKAFGRCERLAPKRNHCYRVSLGVLQAPFAQFSTYTEEQRRDRRGHGGREYDGNHDVGVLGTLPKDVMDLGELAVSQWLLILGGNQAGVQVDLDISDGFVVALGTAEGGEHQSSLERLLGLEELDREIAVFLGRMLARATKGGGGGGGSSGTYEVDSRLSILLGCHDEGSLQASLGLLEDEEGLVRALRLAAFVGCKDELESVGTAESDGLLGKGFVAESVVRIVRSWAGDCR